MRDYITAAQPAVVVFWHSAAPGVFAAGCDEPDAASVALARAYAWAPTIPSPPPSRPTPSPATRAIGWRGGASRPSPWNSTTGATRIGRRIWRASMRCWRNWRSRKWTVRAGRRRCFPGPSDGTKETGMFSLNQTLLDDARTVFAGYPQLYWILGGSCGQVHRCPGHRRAARVGHARHGRPDLRHVHGPLQRHAIPPAVPGSARPIPWPG
ncbi:MAG: hypothetical protein R2854_27100 [Caldilineaceae bacterium]